MRGKKLQVRTSAKPQRDRCKQRDGCDGEAAIVSESILRVCESVREETKRNRLTNVESES